MIATTAYINSVSLIFPFAYIGPAMVEERTEGILAKRDMQRKLFRSMLVAGIKYVSKSLGVPGKKNKTKVSILTFLSSLRKVNF